MWDLRWSLQYHLEDKNILVGWRHFSGILGALSRGAFNKQNITPPFASVASHTKTKWVKMKREREIIPWRQTRAPKDLAARIPGTKRILRREEKGILEEGEWRRGMVASFAFAANVTSFKKMKVASKAKILLGVQNSEGWKKKWSPSSPVMNLKLCQVRTKIRLPKVNYLLLVFLVFI